ncbi:hypothetical protein DSO57_1018701 [Entomophthora muscae]|uniref:Uncharacterized protein n=1 Tax=Entomophthora muscae TaxID=34485 RepID=A0ACC2UDY2_9FUNG|nr:hypothetical protein DSO57_1018701 [Entomophthora muscae]
MSNTHLHPTKPIVANSNDLWVKPMTDYNNHSSYQAELNILPCKLLNQQAKELSTRFKHEFHIADFGCSHGKNSMECIKSAFDGYIGNPSFIRVYLNDLPSNDFGQVFKCLNDPAISINQHPLALKANISTCVNGLSFSNQCFPSDHLHLSFSCNCLHWLEKPFILSRALFGKSPRVTPEESHALAEDVHVQFVSFLKSRAQELKQGGRLVASFLKGGPILMEMEKNRLAYITKMGYQMEDFAEVALPIYYRSDAEVQRGLDQVQTEFRTLMMETYYDSKNGIDMHIYKSATFGCLLSGLQKTTLFTTTGKCEDFLHGFFNSFSFLHGTTIYHALVLERI